MKKNKNIKNSSLNEVFKKSYSLLNKKEKKRLKINIFISFMAGIFEILSVTTFYPLVSIIIEPGIIEKNIFIKNIWENIGRPDQNNFVLIISIFILIILVFSVFLNLISQILATRSASSAQERLSKDFYKNLINAHYKWHLINNPNIIRNIFLTNLNLWNKSIIRIIPSISGQISAILIAFISLIIATPNLGFILLLISGTILYFMLKFIRKKSSKLMIRVKEKEELINIFLTETISGIKDIKISSNENNFIKLFYNINHIIIKNYAAASNWNLLPSYLVILFGQISILITATSLFIIGIKGGELAAIMAVIILVFSRVIPLLNRLGTSLNNIANLNSWIEKIYITNENLKSASEKSNLSFDNKIEKVKWEKVTFDSVKFSYPNSKKIIFNNLNFEIKKGFHYAFIGASGAGKSTAIDLFLGLLQPENGKILVDQTNLKNIDSRKWKKNINYVPQNPLISNMSLRENIAFGVPIELIDDKKVINCLEKTHLIEVLESLDEGIYTNLGNDGINLSGGQKQRVAIARALYNISDILILDEATSALDTDTEKIIKKTIKNLKNKVTIISISHRLSTIKDCDFIFYLENGKIVCFDSFKNFKMKSGLFKELSS